MLLIPCPYCGPRAEDWSSPTAARRTSRAPRTRRLSDPEWAEYLFLRTTPRACCCERWVHIRTAAGAGSTLARDTVTDEILAVYEMGAKPPKLDLETYV